jgi:hypothetical protein
MRDERAREKYQDGGNKREKKRQEIAKEGGEKKGSANRI